MRAIRMNECAMAEPAQFLKPEPAPQFSTDGRRERGSAYTDASFKRHLGEMRVCSPS
jgi:hypothetical protein